MHKNDQNRFQMIM